MEARTGRPLGPDGLPLSPEEEAELARAEARRSRRWAYGALFFALLATVGAAIALVFLFSEAEGERASASRQTVRELQEDVRRLNERSEGARRARSEADTADDRSRSLREQVEDLEGDVRQADSRADSALAASTELNDELNDDIQQLREDVDRLDRDRGR